MDTSTRVFDSISQGRWRSAGGSGGEARQGLVWVSSGWSPSRRWCEARSPRAGGALI